MFDYLKSFGIVIFKSKNQKVSLTYMSVDAIFLFTLLAFLAEVAGTVSGFGSSVFFVPIAAYFFDFHSVLGITALFHIFSNISKIFFFKRGVNWKIVLYLGIPAVIFVGIGAYMTKYLENDFLETILAVFLIVFSIVFLLVRNLAIRPSDLNTIFGGTISGFIAGLVGTGGAIRGMMLSAFNLDKYAFVATSALIDFGVDLSRGFVYFSSGYMHFHDFKFVLILIAVSVVGTFTGKKILDKISEVAFKNIVLFVILGIGIWAIVKQLI